MERHIAIGDYCYDLPEERIAQFPLARRSDSKLLVWQGGEIGERRFAQIGDALPAGELLVFNNTKVIRARVIMHKPSGARIEVFCLEPHAPADYERAFAVRGACEWSCIVGNLRKWKEGCVEIRFPHAGREECLRAWRTSDAGREQTVRFEWTADLAFGELLELLGRIPIPPYLDRESEEIDNTRYQTVYSRYEGSVAAPTAGLHFTPELIESMRARGFGFEEVTLHVGAGTFLPVKERDAARHPMHTEHFEVRRDTLAPGDVELAVLYDLEPFGTTVVEAEMTPAQMRRMILAKYNDPVNTKESHRIDIYSTEPYAIEVGPDGEAVDVRFPGLREGRVYRVAMSDYMYKKYEALEYDAPRESGPAVLDLLREALESTDPLLPDNAPRQTERHAALPVPKAA